MKRRCGPALAPPIGKATSPTAPGCLLALTILHGTAGTWKTIDCWGKQRTYPVRNRASHGVNALRLVQPHGQVAGRAKKMNWYMQRNDTVEFQTVFAHAVTNGYLTIRFDSVSCGLAGAVGGMTDSAEPSREHNLCVSQSIPTL
jgi:hypothetical protein